jgi:hypothetical protein
MSWLHTARDQTDCGRHDGGVVKSAQMNTPEPSNLTNWLVSALLSVVLVR